MHQRQINTVQQLKVYILDDERIVVNILSDMLREVGIENFQTQTNPVEALDDIAQFKPDLIFLDVMMPKINGLDFLKKLRTKHPHTHKIPVFYLTGHSNENFVMEAKKLKVSGYLLKPVEFSKVKLVLAKTFKKLSSSL